jgi:DNA-binding PadR family transcriptional regulator
VYRITAAGREALAVRRLEWATFARAVEAVLARSGEAAGGHR